MPSLFSGELGVVFYPAVAASSPMTTDSDDVGALPQATLRALLAVVQGCAPTAAAAFAETF